MRETTINPQRGTSAERAEEADRTRPVSMNSVSELNNQLYRAYLSGDGAAVERIMALLEKAAR